MLFNFFNKCAVPSTRKLNRRIRKINKIRTTYLDYCEVITEDVENFTAEMMRVHDHMIDAIKLSREVEESFDEVYRKYNFDEDDIEDDEEEDETSPFGVKMTDEEFIDFITSNPSESDNNEEENEDGEDNEPEIDMSKQDLIEAVNSYIDMDKQMLESEAMDEDDSILDNEKAVDITMDEDDSILDNEKAVDITMDENPMNEQEIVKLIRFLNEVEKKINEPVNVVKTEEVPKAKVSAHPKKK